MTEEDKKLLNTFEGKLRHFMYLYEEQQKENVQTTAHLEKTESYMKKRKMLKYGIIAYT